jgi:hypothetical protein
MNHHAPSFLLCAALVVPFVALELANRRGYGEAFPVALFGLMALLSAAFVLVLTTVVRDVRAGGEPLNSTSLVLRLAFLIPLALFWAGLVLDQMPCFLGVPACD